MRILGIESSCDETAAAVVTGRGELLSNVVASQVKIHHPFGGVVPELASREHLRNIRPVVAQALEDAATSLGDIDALAVTQGPGLIGSLLVGLSFAKAVAHARNLPLVPIHHLEGHVFAVELEHGAIPYPSLILIVSGGHSVLVLSTAREEYRLVAQTRDDAAGEAFDKVAKLLGLGYPGGPIIDRLAKEGDPTAYSFAIPRTSDGSLDLSFSGIKTAVARLVREESIPCLESARDPVPRQILDLLASFQHNIVMTLLDRTVRAAGHLAPQSVVLTGGVACNSRLRDTFTRHFQAEGIPVLFPRPSLTTDNAAMIAAAAIPKLHRGQTAGPDLNAFASGPLTRQTVHIPNPLINN